MNYFVLLSKKRYSILIKELLFSFDALNKNSNFEIHQNKYYE